MAGDGHRHVLAIGGLRSSETIGVDASGAPLLVAEAARLSGRDLPRFCVLNTAAADDPGSFLRMYDLLAPVAGRVDRLALFPMPTVSDPEDLLMSADVIFVGGGSVANMLAVWRVHGIDQVMRRAWAAGIVLSGVSAGAICWFSGGTTDSFGPQLRPFTDGLALLPQSYCPHYDSESLRRPLYQSLVASGALASGIACDDGAAAHFVDDSLAEIVTDRLDAHGYLVTSDDGTAVETRLDGRPLAG